MSAGRRLKRRKVALVGLGNVGSQMAGHLARMEEVEEITLCDGQEYSRENVRAQLIEAGDVGLPKAEATGRRVLRIRGDVKVKAIVDRVENVPAGELKADVVVACVDNKLARARINQMRFRWGSPLVDVAIRADGLLARVDIYGSGEGDACMECGFTEGDYEQISRSYSCDGGIKDGPATGASAALGGLAAAMGAIECQKILAGGLCGEMVGRQIVVEAVGHHVYLNRLRRNSHCRFDHKVWEIGKTTAGTLGEIVGAIGGPSKDEDPHPDPHPSCRNQRKRTGRVPPEYQGRGKAGRGEGGRGMSGVRGIAVEGKSWITGVVCRGCGEERAVVILQGRGTGVGLCGKCGGAVVPVGFRMMPRLEVGGELAERSMGDVGLMKGDVVSVWDGNVEEYFELVGAG